MAEKQAEVFAPDPNLKVWVDGELVGYRDASVNVFDHGLLYGDGIFEGIRSYRGRIFERIAHLDRLYASAKALTLEIPIDPPAMSKALDETLEANGLLTEDKDAYIRLVVTRGAGALGISPRKTVKPRIFVIAADLLMYPEEMYEKGMPVIISSVTRNSPNACPPRVKSLNYLNNILAKIEALDANVGEAIMLNAQGHVAEATGDNVLSSAKARCRHRRPRPGFCAASRAKPSSSSLATVAMKSSRRASSASTCTRPTRCS
jgi:branched-chain amino acid aminotransferase